LPVGRDSHRIGHSRGQSLRWKRRRRAAGQHAGDGGDPVRSGRHAWSGLGRASQSGRDAGRRAEGRHPPSGSCRLCSAPDRRMYCRSHAGACNVRPCADTGRYNEPGGTSQDAGRGSRHVCSGLRHSGRRAPPAIGHAGDRRAGNHGGVLVDLFHLFRQPRHHRSAQPERFICRNPHGRCRRLCGGAACRRASRVDYWRLAIRKEAL